MTGENRVAGRFIASVMVVAAWLSLGVCAAFADGGMTIAQAPTAAPGVNYSGDTATNGYFWRVALSPGDQLSVAIQNTHAPSSSQETTCLLSPLVSDTNYEDSRFLASTTLVEGGSATLTYIGTRSGLYTLDFHCRGSRQSYQFTVTVQAHPQTGQEVIGSNLIGTAPTTNPSVSQYGDTQDSERFWHVALHPGDVLSVAIQNDEAPSASQRETCLYSPLTSDVNFGDEPTLAQATMTTGGQATLTYTATRAALYLLDFRCGGDARYHFSITVTLHAQTGREVVGTSLIATAPVVSPGVAQFGDTRDSERYWRVALHPGDRISATVGNDEPPTTSQRFACLFSPLASDVNLGDVRELAQVTLTQGGKGTLAYTATRAGLYTLDLRCGEDARYHFTVAVTPHAETGHEAVGGNVIATAPTIQPGTTQFGDTNDDELYWRVSLKANDVLTIDVAEAEKKSSATRTLYVLPPNERDSSYSPDHALAHFSYTTGGRRELNFTAKRAGTYDLRFDPSQVYSFSALIGAKTTVTVLRARADSTGTVDVRANIRSPAGHVHGICVLLWSSRSGLRSVDTGHVVNGACHLSTRRLPKGRNRVVVYFDRTTRFAPSSSRPQTIVVT